MRVQTKRSAWVFDDFARISSETTRGEEKGKEGRRERERRIKRRADAEPLKVLDVRVTCHGPRHVTRGAVDLRGASLHEDRDGGCLLSTACHISVPADFSSSRHGHGMLDDTPHRRGGRIVNVESRGRVHSKRRVDLKV